MMTIYEALDDAAAFLRREGMHNLARAVEAAATQLGQPAEPVVEPPRDVVGGTRVDEPNEPGAALRSAGLGERSRAEFEAGRDLLLKLSRLALESEGDRYPRWARLAKAGLAKLVGPASGSQLGHLYDVLCLLDQMTTTPPAIATMVADQLAAMPRTRRLFGDPEEYVAEGNNPDTA